MKSLVIYGAGGFGCEVLDIARSGYGHVYGEIAFVDDRPFEHPIHGLPVYSEAAAVEHFSSSETDAVIAVGSPHVRMQLADRARRVGFSLGTLVDPSAVVRHSAVLLDGVVICAMAFVSCDVAIEDNCVINAGSIIGHDVRVGPHCVVSPSTNLLGSVQLAEGVEIGTGAIVFPGTSVGAWSKVAMGSGVYKKVDCNTTVSGNPARTTGRREPGWHLQECNYAENRVANE